jgi:hypothetical protein
VNINKLFLSAVFCLFLSACGGGGGGGGGGSSGGSSTTPLTIATQPSAQSVTAGQVATFSVTASGTEPLAYQWFRGGSAISGANSSSYTTPVTVIADNGSLYKVTITDGSGASITSTEVALTVIRPNLSYLGISEVATCYYYNVTCWFEIYNPTSSTINLSSYQLKVSSRDTTNGSFASPPITTYTFPSFEVAAGAYVIVSGNVENLSQRGTQLVQIRSGNQVPYWTGSGFIELIKDGATVDFVRFGTSSQTPVTSSQWSGSSVSALPYSASSYGKSIARLYPDNATIDTHTASDWSSIDWATPAGRNDVPVGAVDADGDGIPDSAEVSGGTYAGLDLYSMGARTSQKNIFIEVDYMDSTDPGIIPRRESLQMIVDSFNAQSIKVHFDAGTTFSSSFSAQDFNLGQGSAIVAYERCVYMDQTTCSLNTSSRRSIYDWKAEYMDLRRRNIFHYLLMGNSQNANGSNGGAWGVAEVIGNDLLVTMGNSGFTTATGTPLNKLINQQAAVIMHELGHNLGLRHGGNEDTNHKPNYWSTMNYLYTSNGLDQAPNASTAYQRWRLEKGDGTPSLCNLSNSPCGSPSQFIINYSDGSSSNLNEAALSEAANIGRGTTGGSYADWNLNGSLTGGTISRDLNGDSSNTILRDHNDWANLVFPFVRNAWSQSYNNNYLGDAAKNSPLDAMSDDVQPYIKEEPPSIKLLEEIRRAR